MPKETHLEFKVGLFVLLSLAGLTVLIFSISDNSFLEKGKVFRVVFGFANGLKKSAPVRIAGVDEGTVKDIKLFFDRQDSRTKAEVSVWVRKDTQVPVDSVVTINQLGLLGEKYVEIVPGIETTKFFEDGQWIIGEDPLSQQVISQRVLDIVKKLDSTVAGLNVILNDQENLLSIRRTLANVSELSGNLSAIAKDIREGKGTLGKLLYDERFYNDLQGLTADLKENPWKLLYRPKGKK